MFFNCSYFEYCILSLMNNPAVEQQVMLGVVLFDTDEIITAKIENFKDKPATLTMIQRIPGQWKMGKCTLDGKKSKYVQKDAHTLEFEIELPARDDDGPAVKELSMRFNRINVRP